MCFMTTQNEQDIENWDPDEAREKMSAKRLKMPIEFRREDVDEPKMDMIVQDPPEKMIQATKPKIVHRPKNKSALF